MTEGHGDDRYRYGGVRIRADFSSNIPGGIDHSALLRHLAAHLPLVARYPEPEPFTLEGELAARLAVPPESVIVTAGATEAIYLAALMLAREGGGAGSAGGAAVVEPTFAEYGDACRIHGLAVGSVETPFAPPAGCRSLWCCNPNNPTGRVWERAELLGAVDENPGVTFVVDHSYEAFTRRPLLSAAEAAARHNLLLVGSMTKRYAVPGLRLGFLVACPGLCAKLRRLRMPWSVNALAIEAGLFLLREGVGGFSPDVTLTEAARLAEAFSAIGFLTPRPTDTHFMLVEIAPGAGTAAELKEWLARREGILIRNADNFRGLSPRHFRIAAQTPAENDLLIDALSRWKSF